jgi:hypothetical protein
MIYALILAGGFAGGILCGFIIALDVVDRSWT